MDGSEIEVQDSNITFQPNDNFIESPTVHDHEFDIIQLETIDDNLKQNYNIL